MNAANTIAHFNGRSLSELFAADITDQLNTFILSYPTTAPWSLYPNTRRFFIQDGNEDAAKVPFDQIRQKEPWKIMAVLGDDITGVLTSRPPRLLVKYWRDHFGFDYGNMAVLPHESWIDVLNTLRPFSKILSLFPYDWLAPELQAIDPDIHYRLLSKCALADIAPSVPPYRSYHLRQTPLEQVPLPQQFPYLVKTSHGLSGEGTYIIKNENDLRYCLQELACYLRLALLEAIVVMRFVEEVVGNYCVQFYVDGTGKTTLIGATSQLVSETGVHLGGIIRYQETDLSSFMPIIAATAANLQAHGYFGVVGLDILVDKEGAQHVIDANVRINGSTPLCLQRRDLVSLGKDAAKYSTDYNIQASLETILVRFKSELDRRDLIILSALEYPASRGVRTDICGIVSGKDVDHMLQVERRLTEKGLRIGS
jgi:hypothetical protein